MKPNHDESQSSPMVTQLAQSIFEYVIQAAADDMADDEFIRCIDLHTVLPVHAHQHLLALYWYGVLVLVPPSRTGVRPLTDGEQHDLLRAIWTQYYDLYFSLGALSADQVQAKTKALVSRFDDIYEYYQQVRLDDEDPEWAIKVIRFFLSSIDGVGNPTPAQVNLLASRLNYLVETFPSTLNIGQNQSWKDRLSQLLRRFPRLGIKSL